MNRSGRIFAVAVAAIVTLLFGCSTPEEPRRTLTVVYSNDLLGEIRSCGCAAKDYGGLGRRATFVRAVRDTTGDMLLLDGGDLFSSELNYGKEKADLTLRSMALMEYHGIVPGEKDLGFGLDFLVESARRLKLPLLAANLHRVGADTLVFPAWREVTLPSGLRVGIIGVMSDRLKVPPQAADDVTISAPFGAVKKYAAELRGRVDIVAVLAHMARGELRKIAGQVPDVDLVVFGHEGRQTRKADRPGGAYLLNVADRGRYMGVAFAVLNDERRIRYLKNDATPLTDFFADDEAIAKLFSSYDLNIAAKEKTNLPAGVFEARKGIERPFVGAEACKECHEEIYDQWAGTKHAYAFDILVKESREFDRDCTPCHTTGFYKHGGFENFTVTPELVNIQCEQCHGNGYNHANDPDVATGVDASAACSECHNAEQSPDFDFDEFWAEIRHDGGER